VLDALSPHWRGLADVLLGTALKDRAAGLEDWLKEMHYAVTRPMRRALEQAREAEWQRSEGPAQPGPLPVAPAQAPAEVRRPRLHEPPADGAGAVPGPSVWPSPAPADPGPSAEPKDDLDGALPAEAWIGPGDTAMFYGPLGNLAQEIAPTTEADVHAVLFHLLLGFGSIVGRAPHVKVGEARHGTNEFALIVGPTGHGRKGSAWHAVRPVLGDVDPAWDAGHVQSGLSSGEGLKWKIRDEIKIWDKKACDYITSDPGISDKRLFLIEEEFAEVIIAASREGNTLNTCLRSAWDGSKLGAMTRKDPLEVTDPHSTFVAHITVEELIARLSRVDIASGSINRFLFCLSRQSASLPFGGRLPDQRRQEFVDRLRGVVQFARGVGALDWTGAGRDLWVSMYPALNAGRPGAWGKATDRQAPHTLRVAAIFALADGLRQIDAPHVRAALAVTDYSLRSAGHIFGSKTGNPLADDILESLRATPAGMTRQDIFRGLFQGNRTKPAIKQALAVLLRYGLAAGRREPTGGPGRPPERWFASTP
jgi:hypothetical protein